MKLAISNLAWPADRDAEVAEIVTRLGVRGIEVAPTKMWGDLTAASRTEVEAYRRSWEARGIQIVSAQALLFGRPELKVFESSDGRKQTAEYLSAAMTVCSWLGAGTVVFGSPRNREKGDLSFREARDIAIEFFSSLAELADGLDLCLVLEANAKQYGCDFVTDAETALDIVREVDRPGFGLHLDTGCMTMANDPVEEIVRSAGGLIRSVHISEPFLEPISAHTVDHRHFAKCLNEIGYGRWVSVEMRQQDPFDAGALEEALRLSAEIYAG